MLVAFMLQALFFLNLICTFEYVIIRNMEKHLFLTFKNIISIYYEKNILFKKL